MPDIYQYTSAREKILEEGGGGPGMTVERIEFSNGIRIYTKEHPHPHKGLPTPEALTAVNTVKRLTKALLKFKIAPNLFWELSEKAMRPHILKPEYQQRFTKELTELLEHFVNHERAELIAHIFEYDRAYRFRVQDLFAETTQGRLMVMPIREMGKLIRINGERDYEAVSKKVRAFGRARFMLLIPYLRTKFIKAMYAVDYNNLLPDEDDVYWMRQQVDYSYGV